MTKTISLQRCRAVLQARAPYAISLFALACGDANTPLEPQAQKLAIHGGQLETGYPAVGQFGSEGTPYGHCTGTLIDPSWVITARHCRDLGVFQLGADPESAVAYPLDGQRFTQPTGFTNEVTLVHLTNPIYDAPLAELHPEPLSLVGSTCTAVGYGLHRNEEGINSNGTKRSSTSTVESADEYEIRVDEITGAIDSGDSGGPLICDGKVAAVARNRGGVYSPVDAAWVARVIADPSSQPEVPETTEPEQPVFAPEVKFVGAQGDLCPEGVITSEGGLLWGTIPEELPQTGGRQGCKIDLTVTIPAGKKLETAAFCSTLYSFEPISETATLTYSIAGFGSVQNEWLIGSSADASQRCDVFSLPGSYCLDPEQPVEVPFSIEISAPVRAGNPVVLSVIDATLSEANEAVWSSCLPEE